LETKLLQGSTSLEVAYSRKNTGILLSAVLRLIIRVICFSSPTFQLYCDGTGVTGQNIPPAGLYPGILWP